MASTPVHKNDDSSDARLETINHHEVTHPSCICCIYLQMRGDLLAIQTLDRVTSPDMYLPFRVHVQKGFGEVSQTTLRGLRPLGHDDHGPNSGLLWAAAVHSGYLGHCCSREGGNNTVVVFLAGSIVSLTCPLHHELFSSLVQRPPMNEKVQRQATRRCRRREYWHLTYSKGCGGDPAR